MCPDLGLEGRGWVAFYALHNKEQKKLGWQRVADSRARTKVFERRATTAHGLWPFVLHRAGASAITLFLFVSALFFLIRALMPYEASDLGGGQRGIGYFDYLGQLATGSLGTSYFGGSVGSMVRSSLPNTLLIFATGGILAYLFGGWLGRFR